MANYVDLTCREVGDEACLRLPETMTESKFKVFEEWLENAVKRYKKGNVVEDPEK